MSHKTILAAVLPLLTGALSDHQVSIDLTGVDESIAPFVIAIDHQGSEDKPSCADLEIEMFTDGGSVEKVKPSAAQRDEAWQFYQSAKSVTASSGDETEEVQLKENKAGLVPLQFLTFFDGYRKGEVAGFTKERAKELLAFKPAVAKQYTPE